MFRDSRGQVTSALPGRCILLKVSIASHSGATDSRVGQAVCRLRYVLSPTAALAYDVAERRQPQPMQAVSTPLQQPRAQAGKLLQLDEDHFTAYFDRYPFKI